MATRVQGWLWKALIILALLCPSLNWRSQIEDYKFIQDVRHSVLKDMGIWLNENTPENSVVFLEPLGYVGYYADRVMIDQVGLVTPSVVELYKDGLKGHQMYAYLWPDYVVGSCGEYDKVADDFEKYYEKVETFDNGYSRTCYEVWEMK